MTLKKKISLIVLIAVVLGFIGFNVYKNWFKVEKDIENLVGIDRENSIVAVDLSTEKGGRQTYIARSHVKKGFIWKYPIDHYDAAPLYEQRYRRDVMLKDGELSFYLTDEKRLIKFDYETGEVLDQLEMEAPIDVARWTALQDQDSLYLLYSMHANQSGLKAVNFDDFSIRWDIDLGEMGFSNYHQIPIQNKDWLVFHKRIFIKESGLSKREVLILNKKTGESRNLNVGSWGFLKDDSYFYLSSSLTKQGKGLNEENPTTLFRQDLKTNIVEEMYDLNMSEENGQSWEFLIDDHDPISIWNYQDRLVYFGREENRVLMILRDLDTGKIKSRIDLPENYRMITTHTGLFLDGAPEFASFPEVKSRFLPLLLGAVGASSFDDDVIETKVAIFDLDSGSISWESNSIYQTFRSVEDSLREDNFFDEGLYGIFLPVPEEQNDWYMALLLIDGETGEITRCLRLHKKKKIIGSGDYSYKGRRIDDGRIFNLSDRAFFLPDGTLFGSERRRYKIEDMRKEMGEIYGF